MRHYDIQCGEDEETGDNGTWIVRRDGDRWTKIAKFIPGEYTAEDETLLGAAAKASAENTRLRVERDYYRHEAGRQKDEAARWKRNASAAMESGASELIAALNATGPEGTKE